MNDWNWPKPLEDWGTGDYIFVHYVNGHSDWVRPGTVRRVRAYSEEQEAFEYGVDILLGGVLGIAIAIAVIISLLALTSTFQRV